MKDGVASKMDTLLHGKTTSVTIRPLGEQNILFWDAMRRQAGDWISDILSHCVRFANGKIQSPIFFEELVISERLDLLLLVAQASFGNDHYLTVSCPQCTEKMDIDFTIKELRPGKTLPTHLTVGEHTYSIIEPTGRQQRQWGLDKKNWQDDILRYCLGDTVFFTLPNNEKGALLESLLNLQPGTSLELEVNCISCHAPISIPISIASLYSKSMNGFIEEVEEEIHLLASAYHWSEADILSLPRPRRKRYVERVNGQWM